MQHPNFTTVTMENPGTYRVYYKIIETVELLNEDAYLLFYPG
jgi:hypothetical protein